VFQTREVPFLEANAGWLTPLALFVIVLVMVVVLGMRRRSKPARVKVKSKGKVEATKKPDFNRASVPEKKTSTIQAEAAVAEPKAVSKSTKPSTTTMFCRQCGAKIPRDSKFCKECGSKVVS
jgi:ribosomal protein L40E